MKVLVINAGSSSLKYQFIDTSSSKVITKGLIEKIGGNSEYTYQKNNEKITESLPVKNHIEALKLVIENLTDKENNFISSLIEIEAIGHRVVHGGEKFSDSVLINDEVIAEIEKCCEIAPLHNPPNLQGIRACKEVLPDVKQVAVFDTSFHQTMPESSYIYAIPYEYYEKYKIRRYGFHGTSHRYVAMKTAELLEKPLDTLNLITCHMGNGSSITAIKNGKSIDTSMGFTPLEGIVMGTRSGNIDPAIIKYIADKENLSLKEIDDILNKKSGLLGVSGVSNDLREVTAAAKSGNKRAKLARELLIESVRKYIGAYMVKLGRVDAIVFTAGIGENESNIREKICENLENFGIKLDLEKNNKYKAVPADLSASDSKVKIILMPTNEELMIALETEKICKSKK